MNVYIVRFTGHACPNKNNDKFLKTFCDDFFYFHYLFSILMYTLTQVKHSKNMTKNKIIIRSIQKEDIDGMLKVEFARYTQLYEEQPHKKIKIRKIFEKRFGIAAKWMWVAELNGEIAGFISGQPTDMRPQDFTTWEEVTDNGTLQSTYKESGINVYIVNLDVTREAAKLDIQYMLMASLGAQLIKTNKNLAIFESRMPGFREWVFNESESLDEKKWNSLSDSKKLDIAAEYSSMRVEKNGKSVRKDRLLKFYEEAGFNFVKIVPNAFQDGESLNFGMLCTAKNPIVKKMRYKIVNFTVGTLLEKIGKNEKLLSKFVG